MNPLSPETERVLAGLRLVAFDVDGTLTDGRVVWVGAEQLQSFSVHDGQGLVWLRKAGVRLAWISGRGCTATRLRAEELGIDEVHLRAGPKDAVLAAIQQRLDIAPEATLAMGDDLPDLALARRAALFAAPADARPEVCARADLVLTARGGRGAARELAELVLTAKGRWPPGVDGDVRGGA